jgi:hypothetical protein
MYNKYTYGLGTTRSCIRELFEYGMKQAAVVGRENVYDFSIGNPSIPSPAKVNESIIDIVKHEDSLAVHGYTSAPGWDGVRKAVAEDLTARMGMEIKPSNLYFTCGAAPGAGDRVPGAEPRTLRPRCWPWRPSSRSTAPLSRAPATCSNSSPQTPRPSRSTLRPWRA